MSNQDIIKAGKIAKQVVDYAKSIIKKDVPLIEIAEKIDSKIAKLGGKPAFPVNLSINEIAAHYTPSYNDETLASGLLKVDLGVHINGWTADTAFSVDLENSKENKALIKTAEQALENALNLIKKQKSTTTGEIGKIVEKTIEEKGFSPIINLTGHSMEEYDLHAGITIPNIDNKQKTKLEKGLFAIEPFTTTGSGRVKDGKPSEIFMLTEPRTPRIPLARDILNHIVEEYQTLPFCTRWIVKKFGPTSKIALNQLIDNGSLHNFPELIEITGKPVAQAEHTVLIDKDEIIITTE